ncbi:DUF429 domain-containing protein [Aureimonas leprariae]|uniref:DUF429 domain-containing protein n=1 Tax=Plantimonas leprariae TaxID=2615207 RepID=A0A7V7TVI2_9HYPH|nr:DUF429 domain-containing protein [Aureimonas leprariae]KAB0677584.1 DUF429 domain-containing protein [Aureimonas leprariae]
MSEALPALAGVDGCRAGWVAAVRLPGRAPSFHVAARFADLVDRLPDGAVVAVDMPIGLPERIEGTGRVPEQAARRMLGKRRASIFPIPARAAVKRGAGPFADADERRAAFREASRLARDGSDPPKGFSIQAFGIFPKIVEIDRLLRRQAGLASRVFESHPELAFALLNGGAEMGSAKKTAAGAAERRAVLRRRGLAASFLDRPLGPGVGRDDWLDASALLLVAERFARGTARSFPDPPGRDAHGLPVCIRA